jgi:RimJ/RimL family protein N-acetyltransferase
MDADPDVPVLRTERLLLRGWRDADRAPFAALNADSEVAEFLAGALTREQSDALVDRIEAHWRSDGYALWAIERASDGAFLGFTGLSVPAWAPEPTVEVGWRFARFAWGEGYATEAARAAVRFAFDMLGLPALVSYTTVANERSRRVMERIGMTYDPTADFLHPRLPVGHPLRPHVVYRLSRERWRTLPAMDKTSLLADIRRAHAAFEAAASSLDDDAWLSEVPDMGGWTRKDVLAHVEWWSDHSSRVVTALVAGHEPYPRGGEPFDIDVHNARLLDESRARSLDDVRRGEAETYRRVVAAVEAATEGDLFEAGRFDWLGGETLAQTVAADTSEHYAEHLPHLASG